MSNEAKDSSLQRVSSGSSRPSEPKLRRTVHRVRALVAVLAVAGVEREAQALPVPILYETFDECLGPAPFICAHQLPPFTGIVEDGELVPGMPDLGSSNLALSLDGDDEARHYRIEDLNLWFLGDVTGTAWINPNPAGQQPDNDPWNCVQGTIFTQDGNIWFQVDRAIVPSEGSPTATGLLLQNEYSGEEGARVATELPPEEWTQVVFTRSVAPGGTPSTVRFFKNGLPIGTSQNLVNPPHVGSSTLSAGYVEGAPERCEFNGAIDELRVYSEVLSDSEILALFNQVNTPKTGAGNYLLNPGFNSDSLPLLSWNFGVRQRWIQEASVLVTGTHDGISPSEGDGMLRMLDSGAGVSSQIQLRMDVTALPASLQASVALGRARLSGSAVRNAAVPGVLGSTSLVVIRSGGQEVVAGGAATVDADANTWEHSGATMPIPVDASVLVFQMDANNASLSPSASLYWDEARMQVHTVPLGGVAFTLTLAGLMGGLGLALQRKPRSSAS